jgi:putative inorganic carbon (HCO3(-)) transporter
VFLPSSIALAHTCLGLLLLSYLVEAITTKQLILPATPLNRPVIGYVALSLVMILFSPDLSRSLQASTALADVAVFYLIYLAFHDAIHHLKQLKKYTLLFIIYVTLAASYGILQHYLEVDPFRLTQPITFLKHVNNDLREPVRIPGFSSYMTFSEQLAMAIPIALAYFFAIKTPLKKGFLAFSLVLMGLALLWTYTRSAWLATGGALILFGLLQGKKFLFLLLLLCSIFAVLIVLQPEFLARIVSIVNIEENKERIYTWESTLVMISEHPLTGIGKGMYTQLAPAYRTKYDFEFTSRAHAHNNLLQVTVEGGLPILLCFLWLWSTIFAVLYRTYHQLSEEHKGLKTLALGFLCAIIAFFIQGFFEHNFGDSETMMTMWVSVALSLKLQELTSPAIATTS